MNLSFHGLKCYHYGGVISPFNSHCPLLKLCVALQVTCHEVSHHRVARLEVTLEIPQVPRFFLLARREDLRSTGRRSKYY